MIEWFESHQQLVTIIFSATVALSTVVYAVLTALLVKETRQMRRAQTEPKLVAFVEPREEFISFAHLYIQNVGSGPAFNITFELKCAAEDEGGNLLISDFSGTKFLTTGIDYIGPNQRIQSRYTSFTDDYEKKIKANLTVLVKYQSSTSKNYSESFSIDMSQFQGAGGLGTPHLYEIAQSLKKLQEDFRKVSTGFNRLKIDTYTQNDRNNERKQREEYRNEQISPKDDSNDA